GMGVSMLTLHAYPKAMRAAVEAARGSDLTLLGVTVLTSMDEADLVDAGYEYDPHALVLRRAGQALAAGMGGIVCSADEAAAARQKSDWRRCRHHAQNRRVKHAAWVRICACRIDRSRGIEGVHDGREGGIRRLWRSVPRPPRPP